VGVAVTIEVWIRKAPVPVPSGTSAVLAKDFVVFLGFFDKIPANPSEYLPGSSPFESHATIDST